MGEIRQNTQRRRNRLHDFHAIARHDSEGFSRR
jgi:hypothetical protein